MRSPVLCRILPYVAAGGFFSVAEAAVVSEFVRDTFSDEAGTELTQHVGETGAGWSVYLSPDKTKTFGGRYVHTKGGALRHSDSAEGYYTAAGKPSSDEYDVRAVIRKHGGSNSRIGAGVTARMSQSTTTFYIASYYNDVPGKGQWVLAKFVNGEWVRLGRCAMDLAEGQAYELTLQIRNAEKRLLVDGALCVSSPDNSIKGKGYVGLHAENGASTDGSGLSLDDFTASEIVVTDGGGPVAENATMISPANGAVSSRFPASGAGNLSFEIVTPPQQGTATLNSASSGRFSYKVKPGGSGTDVIKFKVSDSLGRTASGSVSILIDAKVTSRDPVMVVAAHPDDEALIAAGVIARALAAEQPVKVVVVTNGDKSVLKGLSREGETVAAMSKLGVLEDDIIFLGYPDDAAAGLRSIYNSFLTESNAYLSPDTRKTTTYGNRGLGRRDFSSYRSGTPAKYSKPSLLADLVDLLIRYRPRKIYTHSVADHHPDHRMVYQLTADAVRTVMNGNGDFRPDLYSQVVHSPAGYPYTDKWAADDKPVPQSASYAADSIWPAPPYSGTARVYSDLIARFTPEILITEPPDLWRTGLLWEDRVSVPVPDELQSTTKANNPKFKAVDAYTSQQGGSDGLIYAFGKMDEVFWVNRWSTNIAPAAKVTASSENKAKFQLATNVTDGIIDGENGNHQAEWATADDITNPVGQSLTLNWARAYKVSEVRLYDRPLSNKQITAAELRFDDGGSVVAVGPLPNDGYTPRIVKLAQPRTISSLAIKVKKFRDTASTKGGAGLAEVEVIGVPAASTNRAPFFVRGPYVAGNRYRLAAGGSGVSIHAPAVDPDNDILNFQWRAAKGKVKGSGSSATYSPPSGVGTDIVTVTIGDGVNAPVSAKLAVKIVAAP